MIALSGAFRENEPNVFDYVDYRAFLGDWISYKKSESETYSHRVFARRAGYSNPSLLGQIIQGKRNLTDKVFPGFMKVLNIRGEAREYFSDPC